MHVSTCLGKLSVFAYTTLRRLKYASKRQDDTLNSINRYSIKQQRTFNRYIRYVLVTNFRESDAENVKPCSSCTKVLVSFRRVISDVLFHGDPVASSILTVARSDHLKLRLPVEFHETIPTNQYDPVRDFQVLDALHVAVQQYEAKALTGKIGMHT
jgi:hypothetical protein